MTIEEAMEQIAESVDERVNLKPHQELFIFKIFNNQTRKVDETGAKIKNGLFSALMRQFPNYHLTRYLKNAKGDVAYLSGFYELKGDSVKIGVQIKQRHKILVTVTEEFEIEIYNGRILFALERKKMVENKSVYVKKGKENSNMIWHAAAISFLTASAVTTANEVEKYNNLSKTNEELAEKYQSSTLSATERYNIEKEFEENKDKQVKIKDNVTMLSGVIILSLIWESYLIYTAFDETESDEKLNISFIPAVKDIYNKQVTASVALNLSYSW